MTYVDPILKRADFKEISSFLLYEGERIENQAVPYEQQAKDSSNHLFQMIRENFPDTYDDWENQITNLNSIYQSMYLEIGIQVGMKLAFQIYHSK